MEYKEMRPRRTRKKNTNKNNKAAVIVIGVLICFAVSIIMNVYCMVKIHYLENKVGEISMVVDESKDTTTAILNTINDMRDEQKESNKQQQAKLDKMQYLRKVSIENMKAQGLNGDTDLAANKAITVDDMNKIIDNFSSHVAGGTKFKGHGDIFIKASKESGLNPVYIFAHAAIESSFGNSAIANDRHNYFGINAIDSDPDKAHAMGESMEDGIINGAKWIKSTYYDKGYTTLNAMKRGGYATDPNWVAKISSVANSSIVYL